MSATITNVLSVPYRRVGNQRKTVRKVVADNSYPSEGYAITAAELGLNNSIEYADVTILSGSENESEFPVSGGWFTTESSGTKGKLHLLNNKTSKEVATGKNVEKVAVQIEAYGW